MIGILNRLVDEIEQHLADDLDIDELAGTMGTTGYHARRMFSSLAGMPVSDYVRRRRMAVAATDVVGDEDLLTIAVRYGYGSTEAFGRAFRSVHGVRHGDVRRNGGPLRSQPLLRFRLTVEGSTPMDARIIERPTFRLIGHAVRVPLIYEGVNPHIQRHIESLPASEHERLKQLSNTDRSGLLQVSADVDPDYTEGSELTYLHGVAVSAEAQVPEDLDTIDVDAGTWVVFRTSGLAPGGSARGVCGVRNRMVPLQPVAAAPRPVGCLGARPCPGLQYGYVRNLVPHRARLSEMRAGLRHFWSPPGGMCCTREHPVQVVSTGRYRSAIPDGNSADLVGEWGRLPRLPMAAWIAA